MSSRDGILDFLEALLPATAGLEKVKLVRSVRATDQLSRSPILIVKTNSFERVASASRWVQGNFTLVLVSNHKDVDKAEDQLDDLIEVLLPKLTGSSIMWDTATQTAYDDTHIAYDITVRALPTT